MSDNRITSLESARRRRDMAPLHVFLREHSARNRVAALSGVALPVCFARVRAADLQGAQRQSAGLRAAAGPQGCTVFVDIEVLVDIDARTALRAADQLGPNSSDDGQKLRYVGTPRGLTRYIADLHTLGISMMLDHLGERTATAAVLTAIETVLARGGDTLTPDMGGTASTEGLGKAVADAATAT
jgi:hypothetical protein